MALIFPTQAPLGVLRLDRRLDRRDGNRPNPNNINPIVSSNEERRSPRNLGEETELLQSGVDNPASLPLKRIGPGFTGVVPNLVALFLEDVKHTSNRSAANDLVIPAIC